MRHDFLSRPNDRGELPLLQIPSAYRFPEDSRYVIKHVLIGQPIAVDRTIHSLHQLRYADIRDWAMPLAIGEPLTIAPAPGDVISTLIRYFRIE